MIMTLPKVVRRKWSKSSGECQGSAPFLPITPRGSQAARATNLDAVFCILDLLRNLIYLLKSPFSRPFDPLLRRLLARVCLAAEDRKAEKIIDFFRQSRLCKRSNKKTRGKIPLVSKRLLLFLG